jgi:hypothetical protein
VSGLFLTTDELSKHVEQLQRAMRLRPCALRFALKVRRLHGRSVKECGHG